MKRRHFIQALAAAPAAPALLAQQASQQAAAPAPEQTPLSFAVPDEAADPAVKFFDARQFATLRRLCDLLVPGAPGSAGALEAHVSEFMDFLIGDSPVNRQQLWLTGLDGLEYQSQTRFGKAFADADAAQANALLAPLRQPWTDEPLTDPVARMLAAAKQDVRTATANSFERRKASGLYWLRVD